MGPGPHLLDEAAETGRAERETGETHMFIESYVMLLLMAAAFVGPLALMTWTRS